MAAALAVSTREIIMAICRRNIAMIAIIAVIGTIAIIAYSPERPFRSRHSTETAPETVRLHRLVRCFGDAEASLARAGCSLKSGPTGARRARSRP